MNDEIKTGFFKIVATARKEAASLPQFSDLAGLTMTRVEQVGDDRVEFDCEDGSRYALHHRQDCCETVEIESIVGDLAVLVGEPILLAEEVESSDDPDGYKHEYQPESQTWTFYKLRTIKGSVDIRWHGTSNGYYSETVDFTKLA